MTNEQVEGESVRGRWIAGADTPRPHQCLPLSWDEVIEEGLPHYGSSFDVQFVWECPDPDCKRWWTYDRREISHPNGISELEVHWNFTQPEMEVWSEHFKRMFWESVGPRNYLVVTTDAASKATWVEPNKYSEEW